MLFSDRSQQSHLSLVSASDGGLTRITDDSQLIKASSDDFAPFQRRFRGYDPVLSYRESGGANFKSAPGESEEACDRRHANIANYQLKTVTSRPSKALVGKCFPNTVCKPENLSNDRKLSQSKRTANIVSFFDEMDPTSRSVRRVLSSAEPNKNTQSRQVSQSYSEASRPNSTISSRSFSTMSYSWCGHSSLTCTSSGTGAAETSGRQCSTDSEPRPAASRDSAQTQRKSPCTASDRPSSPQSSVDSCSEDLSNLRSGRKSAASRLKKDKGCLAGLNSYLSNRKKKAQKEHRRKERKKLIKMKPHRGDIFVKIRSYVRNLVWGLPLGDPTVASHLGTSGTYRAFGTGPQSMADAMSASGRTTTPPPNGPGERALYNKAEYAGRKAVVCSPRRAAAVLVLVFLAVLAIALVAAFARPACLPSTGVVGPTTVAPPVATRPTTADGEPFPWDSLRLPSAVLPRRYELLLQPNLTTFAVVGRVKIQITVTQETSFIVLHSRNMTITKRELHTSDDSVNVSITRLLLYPERDQVYLSVNESLQLGQNYTLSFEFNYTLREALEGFYLSHYTAANGSKRYLATTQFEPNAARAAFPCFDEPQLKATFQLAMVRHESHTALFNTPRRSTADLDFYLGAGIKQDDFFETVRMSTYLVAFIVSDYAHISDTTDGNVLVSVWAPPHLVQQGQFAAQVAVSVLDFYTDYFGLPYQLPKLDLVAIPDFAAGAMENWGLCTFRLTSLLYEPSSGGSAIQQWVTRVVAHELAHQWFGNLVTMEWWNDLWLNEGFATLMEFIGAGHARPEYHMGQQFMLEATLTALALDSLRDSHPISVEVTDPDQIESIFDTISYSKGAAVLYMLMKELGQPVFKAGLNKYLRRHSLGSARTADLWAAVQEAAAEAETPPTGAGPPDVQAMMDSWTRQKSYPLISVVLSAGRLTVRQAPFTQLPPVGARRSDAPLWHVPLSCRLHRRAGLLAVRLNGTASVTVSAPRQSAWYYCNVNKTGVYRVTYPADNWAALQQLLLAGSSHLSVQDRAAIIDDAFSLNRADLLNASVPLRLSTSLSREAGLAPWAVSRRHLDWWLQLLYDQPTHAPLQHFVRRLIAPQYGQLGWSEQGSHVVRRLRALVLAWAVSVRLPEAVARARTLFSDWRNAGLPVPPDLRQLVYSTGVEYGDTGDWQFVWQRYLNATTPTEKNSLLRALGASTDPLILEHFLRISLAGELVRSQDFVLVVESTAANQAARLRLWRFVRLNWHKILDKFGGGTFMIDNIIQELVSRFSTQLELEEVRAFFDGKDLRSASRSLRQALESIQLNIRWRGSHQAAAAAWLEDWSRREAAGAAPPTARHWPN